MSGDEYLLVGALLVLALGAAMLVGTVAAMLQVRRTGRVPGTNRKPAVVATPGIVWRLVLGGAITLAGGAGTAWWLTGA